MRTIVSRWAFPHSLDTGSWEGHPPGSIAAGRNDTFASQVDIGATLLGLLQLSSEPHLPGRDILRMAPGDGYALFNHNRTVAMMQGEQVATLGFGKEARTEVNDPARKELLATASNPELERDAQPLFQCHGDCSPTPASAKGRNE